MYPDEKQTLNIAANGEPHVYPLEREQFGARRMGESAWFYFDTAS